jgi:inner membrane protein
MENIAHSLVGLAVAKAGLERLTPGATTACVIAANLPDADILAGLGGRSFLLEHHRGITHSILGTFVLPVILASAFWGADWLFARFRGRPRRVLFIPLLIAAFLAGATHPLLDWTNNYGVRPFLPWSAKWFYGDLVFIVDPWLWLMVGGSIFVVTSDTRLKRALWAFISILAFVAFVFVLRRSGLHDGPVFAGIWLIGASLFGCARYFRLDRLYGRAVPAAGLLLLVFYWCGLAALHNRAFREGSEQIAKVASSRGESVVRFAAMPNFTDPRNWTCVAESTAATYRFQIALGGHGLSDAGLLRYAKPEGADAKAVEVASTQPDAKVFLHFARFPVERVQGNCIEDALVQFADLRYTEPGQAGQGTFGLDVPVSCDSIQ